MKRPSYSGYAHSIRRLIPSDPSMLLFPCFELTQVISQGSRLTERIPADRAGRRGLNPTRYSINLAALRSSKVDALVIAASGERRKFGL
jgi:hypothetical protein